MKEQGPRNGRGGSEDEIWNTGGGVGLQQREPFFSESRGKREKVAQDKEIRLSDYVIVLLS